MQSRRAYPTDVSDEEWTFVLPYLTHMTTEAPQRHHDLREVFNALRWLARAGSGWRLLPVHFPPWQAVYQQWRRWERAGVFETMVHDLRVVLRQAQGRKPEPSAAILDSRTLRSSPESGTRAGYDAHKKTRGSKVQLAVDTLGHLLAARVTPANEQDRDQVAALTDAVQEACGYSVEVAFVDQGYTGEQPAEAADLVGIRLEVVKLAEAKRGFVLLPKRWVVERSNAWVARFRRLARDYERLPQTLAAMHFVVFSILMLANAAPLLQSP
jgi:transposase